MCVSLDSIITIEEGGRKPGDPSEGTGMYGRSAGRRLWAGIVSLGELLNCSVFVSFLYHFQTYKENRYLIGDRILIFAEHKGFLDKSSPDDNIFGWKVLQDYHNVNKEARAISPPRVTNTE